MHIYISILLQILFPQRLSQNTGQSSLCYRAGPHWPVIPYTAVCICQSQTQSMPPPPVPFGNHNFVFKVCVSVSVLQINSFVSFFYFPHKRDIICCLCLTYFTQYDNLQCTLKVLSLPVLKLTFVQDTKIVEILKSWEYAKTFYSEEFTSFKAH